MKWRFALLLAAGCFGLQAVSWAVPTQITYQGTLKQSGTPMNGLVNMQFNFVDSNNNQIPGTSVINSPNVQVTNGLFSVQLVLPTGVDWSKYAPYLQISIGGQVLSPSQAINSNLYSVVSQTVVDGAITNSKLAAVSVSSTNIIDGAITTNAIGDAQVTHSKLAAVSVSSDNIIDANVTFTKLSPDAITGIQMSFLPAGIVVAYAGTTAPPGWLLCDGKAYDRQQYASLFAVIKTTHGSGDGSTTFNVPDYRGRFIRGVDGGVGRDLDTASRVAMNTNGNTGDAVGSVEGAATQMPNSPFITTKSGAHLHSYLRPGHGGGHQAGSNFVPWVIGANEYGATGRPEGTPDGEHTHPIVGGDDETRPINAYANFIIKD